MTTENNISEWPERIGHFRILGLLGRGGVGEVLSARDEAHGRNVAIKRLHSGLSQVSRIEREARVLARLRHPSIVELYGTIQTEEGPCLVLEAVDGETLAQRLARGPLALEEVVLWGYEVAKVLRFCHAEGFLHRDLKAENVMVDDRGRLKVIDWGLAKELDTDLTEPGDDRLTATGLVVGTSRAMSPEQAQGQALDERSDLFSLGILLFEMVTGVSPFRGSTQGQTLLNLLTAQSPALEDLRPETPRPLVELIERLLAKQVESRPSHAAEVEQSLGAMLDGLQTGAVAPALEPSEPSHADSKTPLTPVQPPPPARPWRLQFGPAGVLMLGCLSTLAMGLGYFRDPRSVDDLPRWVAVPEPEVSSTLAPDDSSLAGLVADAGLRAVVEMPDLRALELDEADGRDPIASARASAADEVLVSRLATRGGWIWVDLRRIRAVDRKLLAVRRIPISLAPEDALESVGRIETAVRQTFGKDPKAPQNRRVEESDYLAFLEIQARVREQKLTHTEALERLDAVLRRSPDLDSALWLAADLAETLFSDTRKGEHIERAEDYLARIRGLTPEDPRPRIHEIRLALLQGRLREAEQILGRLDRRARQDPEALFSRALLLQSRGDPAGAVNVLQALVERRPHRRYLLQLATLEFRIGEVEAAREHLDWVLDQHPGDLWGLGILLQLELMHGDLRRVEELADRLLRQGSHRSYWTNLGLSRFLLGRYESARLAYLQALSLDADHPTTLLNLADTQQALGDRESAADTYRRVSAMLDAQAETRELTAAEKLNRAQCAARLGDAEGAVARTLDVLSHTRQDAEMAYQAALVFSLVGDHTSALIKARRALHAGLDARWFRIPAMRELQPLLSLEPA